MDAASLVTYAIRTQLCNSFEVLSLALLTYDYLLTFHLEIEHVWERSNWNVGVLYQTGQRTLSLAACKGLYVFTGMSFTVGMCAADAVVTMRTWVIWDKSRIWGLVLAVGFVGVWIPSLVIDGQFVASTSFSSRLDPALPTCFIASTNNSLSILFGLVMGWELFVFIMTLIKGLDHIRGKSPLLLTVLYRDGLSFTAILCLLSVINFVILQRASVELVDLLLAFQRVVHSILSSRIILHLREAAVRPSTGGVGTTALELTAMGGGHETDMYDSPLEE